MKFTGLFKKKTGEPEVSQTSRINESLTKLWMAKGDDIFTADKARKLTDDKANYKYLYVNVIREILDDVQNAACRHKNTVYGSIENMNLSDEEIEYCVKFLTKAGYKNVSIFNISRPEVWPISVEYSLDW